MLMRRFRTLLFRHSVIHAEIEAEQGRPKPDSLKLLKLKRLRLAIKDRMHRIAAAIEQAEHARAPTLSASASDIQQR